MSNKKIDLKKRLSLVDGVTQQDIDQICDLFDKCRTEFKDFLELSQFVEKGKIEICLNYEIQMDLNFNLYETWTDEKIEDYFLLNGKCEIIPTEPAGYNISQFVSEKHFGNMGIDTYEDASKVHPAIKNCINSFIKARFVLIKKLQNTMKEMNFDKEFQDWTMDFIGGYLYELRKPTE